MFEKQSVFFLNFSRSSRTRAGPIQAHAGPYGPIWAHMGSYGPIWSLMLVFKSVTFRVQPAPFDKIRIEFWGSRKRLHTSDLLKAKNSKVRSAFLLGGSASIKNATLRVQTALLVK